ncbi:SAM-dependent methyltransferase [Sneathiella glossodoripedis]|uniref:SAM-dependent methyltransferase n=1 Tax=Sneathiella glossodoripedis TaxID=418853 RepID=UPI00046F40B2|nr:cyclopropane-fatty-acyl-phospholipid synthase family protein [Sneathiella glossodoripedis]
MSSASAAEFELETDFYIEGDPRVSGYKDVWMHILFRLLNKMSAGHLVVQLPNGEKLTFAGERCLEKRTILYVKDLRMFRMIFKNSDVGLGESYMKGYWSCENLTVLIELALLNESALKQVIAGKWIARTVDFLKCLLNANTKRGSRRNISHHYDLGNEFYKTWLDRSMTYSSAIFESADETLLDAQARKYEFVSNVANVKEGSSILEIGCGWGGFAEHILEKKNTSITALTLSKEQLDYASNRLPQEDMHTRVDLRLEDYREHSGNYDAIVSIEMFEAVGMKNWGSYFRAISRNLKPGGKAAIQVITIAEDRFERYQKFPDFIQKYIFPGGFLPSKTAFINSAEENGFQAEIRKEFGQDYARTLSEWNMAFQQNWRPLLALGFDARFKKMWEFYLQYCEAGFRQKALDVVIFELSKK